MSSRNDRRTGGVHAAVRWVRCARFGDVSSCALACCGLLFGLLLAPAAFAQEVECATIRWDSAVGPVAGYDVYVEINGGGLAYYTDSASQQTTIRGAQFVAGDALRIQVVAYADDGRRGDPSDPSNLFFCEAVPAPSGLGALDGSLEEPIELDWDPVPFAEFYVVFRSLDPGVNGSFLARPDSPYWQDASAEAGLDYYYRVAAVAGRQVSQFSDMVSARTAAAVPQAVSSASVLSYSAGPGDFAATQTFELRNVGGWPVDYQLWASATWISIDSRYGSIDDEAQTFEVRYDLSNLEPGEHIGKIYVYSYYEPEPGEDFVQEAPQEIEVRVVVPDANAPPVIETSLDLSVVEGSSNLIPIVATDPDGDFVDLWMSAQLPSWAVFENLGDGKATLLLEPGEDAAGVYQAVLGAWDDRSPSGSSFVDFTIVVEESNRKPQPVLVEDQTVKVGEALSLSIAAYDPDVGDRIAIVPSSLPEFAQLTDFGNGSGEILLEPQAADVGSFLLIVGFVDDGNPPSFSALWFTVTVEP